MASDQLNRIYTDTMLQIYIDTDLFGGQSLKVHYLAIIWYHFLLEFSI